MSDQTSATGPKNSAELTLWELATQESCQISGFRDDLDARYKDRVLELGFRPKTLVTCLKRPSFGAPRVYQVNNSVFCLESVVASNILIESLSKSP